MSTSVHAALLATLPANTTRVQVTTDFGHVKFKKVADVSDTDTINLNSSGQPIVMSNSPGRKSKIELKPINEKVGEMLRAKVIFVDDDPLLSSVRQNPEGSTVLDFVITGLAEEAASLSFERTEAERRGEETSQISIRKINALKAVGDTWIKRKEQLSNGAVDLDSPAFKRVFEFIMDTFRETLSVDVQVRPEMIETIFTAFSRRLTDDWSREAVKKMSNK
jgi:hypothetical protein